MSIRVLILVWGIVLLACGCNKISEPESTTEQPTAPQGMKATGETGDAAPDAMAQESASASETAEALNSEENAGKLRQAGTPQPSIEELSAQVKAKIIALAPQHNLVVDEQADVVGVAGNPQKQKKLSILAKSIATQIIELNRPLSDAYLTSTTTRELDLLNKVDARPGSGQKAGDDSRGRPRTEEDNRRLEELRNRPIQLDAKLHVPLSIIGCWRSKAEIKDQTIINHDDNYYNLITFYDETTGSLATHRDGELASHRKFTYTFDAAKGRLIIKFEDADVWTILVKQPDDNPAELRLTQLVEGLTTVFRTS